MFALIFFGHYVVISVFLFTFALKIPFYWTNEAFASLGVDEPNVFDDTDGLDFEAINNAEPDVILAVYSSATYPALIATNYLGFLLLGFSYVSIGVLMSALTENQVSAAVLTIGVNMLLQILESVGSSITIPGLSFLNTVISWMSLYKRFNDFSGGILSFANVIYYISFCGVMLFLAVRVIDKRRWSEG